MDIDESARALRAAFPPSLIRAWSDNDITRATGDSTDGIEVEGSPDGFTVAVGSVIELRANAARKVTHIWLSGAASNAMFRAESLSSQEFVEMFAEAYGIERFEYAPQPTVELGNGIRVDRSEWRAHLPDGSIIRISGEKGVALTASQAPSFR